MPLLFEFDREPPISRTFMAYLKCILSILLGIFSFAFAQYELPDRPLAITINAEPFTAFETNNPAQKNFGSLEFRGGLVLTSSYKAFGGISALHLRPDGERFVALSDRALWLRGRIVYKGTQPVGIAEAEVAPVLDEKLKPAPKWDTESMAMDDGRLYVGLERIHSILCFDYGKKGVLAGGSHIPVPPEMKDLPNNQSLEALVYVPKQFRLKGALIAFSERGLTEDGNFKSFLIGGPTPGMFSVKRSEGYDISDAALLPCGDVLILERQYTLERGVSMRLRRLQLDSIKPGALLDGPVIMEADGRHEIDNMEALSVHRARSGEILLTLLSDNNLSSLQRTVFLQFVLRDQ